MHVVSQPGYRLWPEMVTIEQEEALVAEALRLKDLYGFESTEPLPLVGGNTSANGVVSIESLRVTGRPERSYQKPAPWGYAVNFREDLVPDVIREVVDKIRVVSSSPTTSALWKEKSLRDITINYRVNSMFKLDPHVDPEEDGTNIFVMGLRSDVVFTLSPTIELLRKEMAKHRDFEGSMRTNPTAIALRSWTDADLDILLKRRGMVHMFGDARKEWRHCIRTGLEVGEPINGVCDWWGSTANLIKRDKERISFVFAFE